jgi:hypothetical protein
MTTAERPDIAQMRATMPQKTGPSSVDLQAAAQRAGARPYVEFDGAHWYLARPVDLFDLAELGEAIDSAETNPLGALGVINRCLREWVADYAGLRARFRAQHADAGDAAMEAYAALAQGVFAAVTARPTETPADSSAGRSSTWTSSRDAEPSPAATSSWLPLAPG